MMRYGELFTRGGDFGGGYGMMGGAGGFLMVFMMLLILTLTVLSIIGLVKYIRSSSKHDTISGNLANDKVLAILNERFALGEVSDEEYAKKKLALKQH
ncbi:MAG: SHOCT domain-containing protein [Clostridia bacterium]